MKSDLLKCTYFFLAALLVLTSCSIEKRLHRPGYHVEWHRQKVQQAESLSAELGASVLSPAKVVTPELLLEETAVPAVPAGGALLASAADKNGSGAAAIDLHTAQQQVLKTPAGIDKKVLKAYRVEAKAQAEALSAEGGSSGLRVVGWVLIIIGFITLLFASILAGALVMVLGLVFVLAG